MKIRVKVSSKKLSSNPQLIEEIRSQQSEDPTASSSGDEGSTSGRLTLKVRKSSRKLIRAGSKLMEDIQQAAAANAKENKRPTLRRRLSKSGGSLRALLCREGPGKMDPENSSCESTETSLTAAEPRKAPASRRIHKSQSMHSVRPSSSANKQPKRRKSMGKRAEEPAKFDATLPPSVQSLSLSPRKPMRRFSAAAGITPPAVTSLEQVFDAYDKIMNDFEDLNLPDSTGW